MYCPDRIFPERRCNFVLSDGIHYLNKIKVEFGDACFILYLYQGQITEQRQFQGYPRNLYHQHPYYEIQFILNGKISGNIQNKRYLVEKGKVFLIPPGTIHLTEYDDTEFSRICLNLTLEKTAGEEGCHAYFQELLDRCAGHAYCFSDTILKQVLFFNKMTPDGSIENLCQYKIRAYELIHQLFRELDNNAVGSDIKNHVSDNDLMVQLQDMVCDIRYPLCVIAERIGYSERHTSRLIQQIYGKSLLKLRHTTMLESAKRLFEENPAISVQDVAARTGFSSPTALYRAFQKYENCSPSTYGRKQSNQKEHKP